MRILPSCTLVAAALALVACSGSAPPSSTDPPVFPADPLTTTKGDDASTAIEVRTAPVQPPSRGVVDVELTVHDRDGHPLTGLKLDVTPWMSAHGHGASTAPTVIEEGQGRYWVQGVDLFMPGEWDLRVVLDGAVHDHADATFQVQ